MTSIHNLLSDDELSNAEVRKTYNFLLQRPATLCHPRFSNIKIPFMLRGFFFVITRRHFRLVFTPPRSLLNLISPEVAERMINSLLDDRIGNHRRLVSRVLLSNQPKFLTGSIDCCWCRCCFSCCSTHFCWGRTRNRNNFLPFTLCDTSLDFPASLSNLHLSTSIICGE